MKLSLKLQDQHQNPQSHHQTPLLLRAKVPITVLGLPFLSGVSAGTDLSDPSLSLRTSFSSGPSLKLSYTPTTTTATAATTTTTTTTAAPFTLTLKSGISLFGSPHNSPLIISAHFTLSPQNPNPNPTFSLQFKPQFGDFSLCKTTHSSPNPNPKPNGGVDSFGFVPLEMPVWKDMTMESCAVKNSILSGIAVNARTVLPVTNRVAVNFRWGINFLGQFGKQLPSLTVNKIGIERVNEVKEVKEVKVKSTERSVGDLEVLKCVFLQMGRELDVLRGENREMKHTLEEMRLGNSVRNHRSNSDSVAKKTLPEVENSGGFEQWRKKKSGGEENERKELKKKVNPTSNVESELERAIRAASS